MLIELLFSVFIGVFMGVTLSFRLKRLAVKLIPIHPHIDTGCDFYCFFCMNKFKK